jgi:hypothetical protein
MRLRYLQGAEACEKGEARVEAPTNMKQRGGC